MRKFTTPSLLRMFFPDLHINFRSKEGVIYLTFDDGPDPQVTPLVLSLLKKHNAKATFFCLGENIQKHTWLFDEIIHHQHETGNHTFSHINGWCAKNTIYLKDIEKANNLIHSNLFRPPYGKITPKQIHTLRKKYNIILWDVLSYDFDQTLPKENCLKNVLKNTTNGSIVVFHDTINALKNLQYTLPKFLDYFCKHGFSFESINFKE